MKYLCIALNTIYLNEFDKIIDRYRTGRTGFILLFCSGKFLEKMAEKKSCEEMGDILISSQP